MDFKSDLQVDGFEDTLFVPGKGYAHIFDKYTEKFFTSDRNVLGEKLLDKFNKLVERGGESYANKRLSNIIHMLSSYVSKYHVYNSKEECEPYKRAFYSAQSTYTGASGNELYYPLESIHISDTVAFTYCLLADESDTVYAFHRP
ncbi:MAG: hypothetical protein ACRDD8_11265 [Bacteroidales bacterium]